MNTFIRLLRIGLVVSSGLALSPQSAEEKHESLQSILERIPSQDQIDHFKKVLDQNPSKQTEFGRNAELKLAEETLQRVRESIPKLRERIKVGKSMFDYPGLLSRGRISFEPGDSGGVYHMYIGVYLRPLEGSTPFDFEILFSSTGKILKVGSIVWKS
jgi:hypothetical protein